MKIGQNLMKSNQTLGNLKNLLPLKKLKQLPRTPNKPLRLSSGDLRMGGTGLKWK